MRLRAATRLAATAMLALSVTAGLAVTTAPAVAVIIAPVLAAASLTSDGGALAALTTLAAGAMGAALCLPLAGLTHRRTAARATAVLVPAAS